MSEVSLSEKLTCKALKKNGKVCGYSWLPRSKWVFRCPHCFSFRWNEEPEPEKVKK